MVLLNPHSFNGFEADIRSLDLLKKTIAFFEAKGKIKIKEDDNTRVWYSDFLEFQKREKIFARLLTPALLGDKFSRWDTFCNAAFAEILGFYGLGYWYTWQVSLLGLAPIWMSQNDALKQKVAEILLNGGVFSFGLSEKEHGADIYATEMELFPQENGGFLARGSKYYIAHVS